MYYHYRNDLIVTQAYSSKVIQKATANAFLWEEGIRPKDKKNAKSKCCNSPPDSYQVYGSSPISPSERRRVKTLHGWAVSSKTVNVQCLTKDKINCQWEAKWSQFREGNLGRVKQIACLLKTRNQGNVWWSRKQSRNLQGYRREFESCTQWNVLLPRCACYRKGKFMYRKENDQSQPLKTGKRQWQL